MVRTEMPWPFSEGTQPGVGVENHGTREGEELGRELRRLVGDALATADLCDECAFRPGTLASRSPFTQMDVVKCLMEGKPFHCHKGAEPLCAGFVAAMRKGS